MAFRQVRRLYTADNGDTFLVRLSPEIGDAVDSGLVGYAFGWNTSAFPTTTRLPQGLKMRHADLVSADGATRRSVPVANPATATLWQNPNNTVDLHRQDGTTANYLVTGLIGEKRTLT